MSRKLFLEGIVHEIGQDQREAGKAVVRLDLKGVKTRPAFSMSFEEAGNFSIGERVQVTLEHGIVD